MVAGFLRITGVPLHPARAADTGHSSHLASVEYASTYGSTSDSFKAAAGDARVMDGMSGIAVAKLILDQPEIIAPIRESEAAGVAQHVRIDRR